MEDFLKQLGELNELILVANRRDPISRDEPWDLRQIEEVAGRLLGFSEKLKHSDKTLAVVKMAAVMHECPGKAVGRLGRALRDKGVIFE